MPPHGNLDEAEAVLAFPFGLINGTDGQYTAPGTTNLALADYISSNPQLREKDIVLSEELADALDGDTDGSIKVITNFRSDGKASTTYDYAVRAGKYFREQGIGTLAVVAYRHHAPRANASVRRVGLNTVLPELRHVGDFDPDSSQEWTTSRKAWIARELVVVPASALLRQI